MQSSFLYHELGNIGEDIFVSLQKVISCRPIFPQFPHVRWGEHFLFGQFLKLSKLFRNFLSNERIVNYGQKLAQRKRNFCQITNLFPTWEDKFEAEIKKTFGQRQKKYWNKKRRNTSQFVTYFWRGEVGKCSVVWRKTQFEDNARNKKSQFPARSKPKESVPSISFN